MKGHEGTLYQGIVGERRLDSKLAITVLLRPDLLPSDHQLHQQLLLLVPAFFILHPC